MSEITKKSALAATELFGGQSSTQIQELRKLPLGDSDSERRIWGKILLKKWTFLYFTLWAFMSIALVAENEPIQSSLLAMLLAFAGATLITFTMGSFLVVRTRSQLGRISAEEKLLAAVFIMALCTLYPFCWYFRLGWAVALSLTLLLYQSLVMLSRHSSFSEKLLTGDSENPAKLFPNGESPNASCPTK